MIVDVDVLSITDQGFRFDVGHRSDAKPASDGGTPAGLEVGSSGWLRRSSGSLGSLAFAHALFGEFDGLCQWGHGF